MSKFPVLNTYRFLANVGAVLLLIVGVLFSIGVASNSDRYGDSSSFDLLLFLSTAVPFVVAGFMLAVVAELIALALRAEDHLDAIRQSLTAQSPASEPVWKQLRPSVRETNAGITSGPLPAVTETAVLVRAIPGDLTTSVGRIEADTPVTLYARSADSAWVDVQGDGQHWVLADSLKIDGRVGALPFAE